MSKPASLLQPIAITTCRSSSKIDLSLIQQLSKNHQPTIDHWQLNYYDGKYVGRHCFSRDYHDSELANQAISSKTSMTIGYNDKQWPAAADRAPFSRELWGRNWTLLATGWIDHFIPTVGSYEAVGECFYEQLLCDYLNKIRQTVPRDAMPQQLIDALLTYGREYQSAGVEHLVLSNGEWLFILCGRTLQHLTQYDVTNPDRIESHLFTNMVENEVDFEPFQIKLQPTYHAGDWALWQTGNLIFHGQE